MTKLTAAIRDNDTERALRIISYRDPEPLIALILSTLAHLLLSPFLYLIIRYLFGDNDIDFGSLRINYIEFSEQNDGYSHGYTPMHLAAINGNVRILDALYARGADVDAKHINSKGTPLRYALANGKIDAARWLLDHGASVSRTILFDTVNNLQTMQFFDELLLRGAQIDAVIDMVECSTSDGDRLTWVENIRNLSLLGKAILTNSDSEHATISRLLDAGVNPNIVFKISDKSHTALSIALSMQRWHMAVVLLRAGAVLHLKADVVEYHPYRVSSVPIFDQQMLKTAFRLAHANGIQLSTTQLGDVPICFSDFIQSLEPTNIPEAIVVAEPVIPTAIVTQFSNQVNASYLGSVETTTLANDSFPLGIPAIQTEIVIPDGLPRIAERALPF